MPAKTRARTLPHSGCLGAWMLGWQCEYIDACVRACVRGHRDESKLFPFRKKGEPEKRQSLMTSVPARPAIPLIAFSCRLAQAAPVSSRLSLQ